MLRYGVGSRRSCVCPALAEPACPSDHDSINPDGKVPSASAGATANSRCTQVGRPHACGKLALVAEQIPSFDRNACAPRRETGSDERPVAPGAGHALVEGPHLPAGPQRIIVLDGDRVMPAGGARQQSIRHRIDRRAALETFAHEDQTAVLPPHPQLAPGGQAPGGLRADAGIARPTCSGVARSIDDRIGQEGSRFILCHDRLQHLLRPALLGRPGSP